MNRGNLRKNLSGKWRHFKCFKRLTERKSQTITGMGATTTTQER